MNTPEEEVMSDFVHLHVHSEYSLLDGAIRLNQNVLSDSEQDKILHISPLTQALKEMGMTACALPGHAMFYVRHPLGRGMRGQQRNPLSGREFYVGNDRR